MTRLWMLTGAPGVGKSTVLARVVDRLRREGYTVGGVMASEVRERGVRVGFTMRDLATGRRGTLATTRPGVTGPRMGRYRVNLTDLAEVGAKALLYAVEAADIVVCDEVGPMELFSPEFIRAVRAVLASGKPVLGVIHQRMKHPLLNEIRAHPECRVVEVTYDNRDRLADELVVEVLEALKGGG